MSKICKLKKTIYLCSAIKIPLKTLNSILFLMMKKFIFSCALLALCLAPTWAVSPLNLLHIKGTHAVGVRAGTGWGDTFDIGLSYQYYFHRRWSVVGFIDYERGIFDKSGFWCVNFTPGIEAALWQPTNWLYIHATANALLGYDKWENTELKKNSEGVGIGLALGVNMEFYALPQLSFTLAAQQGWKYSFLSTENTQYFSPLFTAGVRYNIQ